MNKLVLAALVCMTLHARAQEAQEVPGEPPQTVVVSGTLELPFISYKSMLRGVASFEKHRALAPAAGLLFKLRDVSGNQDLSKLRMKLQSAAGNIEVPIATDGRFALPAAPVPDPDAELVLNRPKRQLRLAPLVMSPGTTAMSRRLGDLRLECRVWFDLEDRPLGFLMRPAVNLAGGPCSFKSFLIWRRMPPGAKTATIVSGERTKTAPLSPAGDTFLFEYYDKTWPDDSLIVFGADRPTESAQ